MIYTTLDSFKTALGTDSTGSDAELTQIMTAVSRAVDRRCTSALNSDDYFKIETITDEEVAGQINRTGQVVCYPHKPRVQSVSEFSYRHSPYESWKSQDVEYISIQGGQVTAWTSDPNRERVFVKLSYAGGLFEEGAIPADFQDAVNLLCVRFFKEVKSGLGDSIGVAELGTLVYTKAWPSRVLQMLQPYMRVVPWT